MAARISTRISIKWAAEETSEPTDTLVLSLGGYYVDLRITKIDNSIDWALAGQRIVVSEQPQRVKFTYSINSQDDAGSETHAGGVVSEAEAADIGQFVKLPNGDDFETGEMAAPHLGGEITPYEEVWRQLHPSTDVSDPVFTGAKAWILESVDHDDTRSRRGYGVAGPAHKTFLARIGPFFMAVRRREVTDSSSVDRVTRFVYGAIRQDFDSTGGHWASKYSVGDCSNLWIASSGITFPSNPQRSAPCLKSAMCSSSAREMRQSPTLSERSATDLGALTV